MSSITAGARATMRRGRLHPRLDPDLRQPAPTPIRRAAPAAAARATRCCTPRSAQRRPLTGQPVEYGQHLVCRRPRHPDPGRPRGPAPEAPAPSGAPGLRKPLARHGDHTTDLNEWALLRHAAGTIRGYPRADRPFEPTHADRPLPCPALHRRDHPPGRRDAVPVASPSPTGRITRGPLPEVDLTGYLILPGIIDLHGDAFERHTAPRPSAPFPIAEVGLRATDREAAANGITTAWLAQSWSWEGGKRGPDYRHRP